MIDFQRVDILPEQTILYILKICNTILGYEYNESRRGSDMLGFILATWIGLE